MVQLRFYTYDSLSNEKVTPWSFEPLEGPLGSIGLEQDREQERNARGRFRRQPYTEQEVRTLTVPAGVLFNPASMAAFRQLLRAHKIEWSRFVGGKQVWVEFDLDISPQVEFEILEEINPIKRFTMKLVQSDPLLAIDFENVKKQFSD